MSHPSWSFLSPVVFPPKKLPRSERLCTSLACPANMRDIYKLGYDAWGNGMRLNEYLSLCESSRKYQNGTWILFSDRKTSFPIVALICYQLVNVFDIPVIGIGSIATNLKMRGQGYASEALATIVDVCAKDLAIQLLVLFPDKATSMYRNLGFVCTNPLKDIQGKTIPMYYRTKQAKHVDIECILHKVNEIPYF